MRFVPVMMFILSIAANTLHAADIPIVNPSFEADLLAEGTALSTVTGWTTSTAGAQGIVHYTPGVLTPIAISGTNVAWAGDAFGGTPWVRQNLSDVLEVNNRYVLSVWVGRRVDYPFSTYTVRLIGASNLILANTPATPAPGTWELVELTYDALPGDLSLGSPLSILLGGNNDDGVVVLWDDVSLRTIPLPACEGDPNGDAAVDVNDISYVLFRLGESGTPGTVDGDANGDGIVDVNDISFVLFRLGNPC